MDQKTPPDWNFFGTVERLIKATEALIEERPAQSGNNQDLVQNMVMRLTVIMEDSADYLAHEEQSRRTMLEGRLNSIRSKISMDQMPKTEVEREIPAPENNVRRLQRITS